MAPPVNTMSAGLGLIGGLSATSASSSQRAAAQNAYGAAAHGAAGGASAASAFDGIFNLLQTQLLLQSGNPVYGMLMLALIGAFVPIIRNFVQLVLDFVTQSLRRRTERLERALREGTERTLVDPETNELVKVHSIVFIRQYSMFSGAKATGDFTTADAILDAVIRQSNVQRMLVVSDLEMITNLKQIEIQTTLDLGLVFQLLKETRDENGDLRAITFEISSTRVSTDKIRMWTREITEAFVESRKNEIGDRTCFFDQIVDDQRLQTSTVFTMTSFQTNRTLENVFFDRDDEVKHRVRFFAQNRAWYDQRGIPYTLGFLFFSPPGCGKTSTVKAIANELKRHVFNINLSAIKTRRQLKRLFYDPTVEIMTSAQSRTMKTVSIPIEKRLYVIEDMDCIDGENDFLMRRSDLEKNRDNIERMKERRQAKKDAARQRRVTGYGDSDESVESDLDLATILNVLDGTLETPGRVILFTSNHPEKLDHALIRPGRIDAMIEFGMASHSIISRMFENFYDVKIQDDLLAQIKPFVWTPAEISQVFFRNFLTPDDGIRYLIEHDPKDDFRRFETLDRDHDHNHNETSSRAPEVSNADPTESSMSSSLSLSSVPSSLPTTNDDENTATSMTKFLIENAFDRVPPPPQPPQVPESQQIFPMPTPPHLRPAPSGEAVQAMPGSVNAGGFAMGGVSAGFASF